MTETSASSDPVQNENDNENQSNPPPTKKKKRNPPGMPDPDAEIIALSPRTLLATNRFVCEICSKGFQRDQNLQLHRRLHELPYKLEPRSDKEIKKRVYVCPEPSCVYHDPSRALGDLTGIKKHYSRKHGEKKWKCDKCSKSYAVKSDWTAHSKICGTKEYRCDCGKLFFGRVKFSAHRAFCYSLIEGCFKDQGVKEGSAHSFEDPNLKITPSSNVDSNLLVPSDPQEAPAHSSSFEDPNLKINPSSNVDSNLPVPSGQQEAPAQSSSSDDPNLKNPSSNVASNLHVPSAPQATTSPETSTALITCSPAETTGTNSSTLENMEQEKLKKEAIRRRKRMYDRRRRVRMRLPEFNGAFAATPIAAINPERHQDSQDSMPNCAVQTAIEMQIPDIQEARSEVSSQASSSKDQSPATNGTVAGKDCLSSGTTQPASSVTEDGSLETPINQGSSSTPSLCLELAEYRPIFKGPLNSPTVMATERPSSPIQAHQTSLEK